MYRFTMPDPALPLKEQKSILLSQFDDFTGSDALRELFALLGVDRQTFCSAYNGRISGNGSIRETQELKSPEALEKYRARLYPLLDELGFFSINTPLYSGHSHILIPGGSLEACHNRTSYALKWITLSTRFVDGLSCYRPINPVERETKDFSSSCETEFGAMCDSFSSIFRLSGYSDAFHGDRNLNSVSCVRTYSGGGSAVQYRVSAVPSTQPQLRRADSDDSFLFYLQNTPLNTDDSLLVITHNRYCNRQFVQLALQLLRAKCPLRIDVTGCVADSNIVPADRYDAYQFLQDLISLLDWIDRFRSI